MKDRQYWKQWFKAAGIRAIKTFAQSVVTLIGTQAVGVTQLDWSTILAVSATTAVVSIATSIAGLPEVKLEEAAETTEDLK